MVGVPKSVNRKKIATELTCTLPNMPKMKITAVDVLDKNGGLKYYFGTGKTVCDVLGWMNEGMSRCTFYSLL